MKRISFSILLAVAFVLLYCAQPAIALQQEKGVVGLANLPPSNENEWSEEESEEIAEFFLRNSPTFISRNTIEDSLTLLNTTLLEQPFSWQFDYEFKCELAGYGRTQGPTPMGIIPHRAEIVVQEGKIISAVLDDKWDMLLQIMIGAAPEEAVSKVHPEEAVNQVYVGFVNEVSYSVPAWVDSFTNTEVTGVRRWRVSSTENIKDETGEPVRGLTITLDSDITFDWAGGWDVLTQKMGPPTYEWFYGDLSEDYTGHPKDANVTLRSYGDLTKFRPGFDVFRSFDKTVFTAPDTQTVTVTFTKREETFERVVISVATEADTDLVDAVIIAHSDEWYDELSADDHAAEFGIPFFGIPVRLNTPLTITVTIQVTPKVSEVVYKPHVHVAPCYPQGGGDSGTVQGSSFSYTNEAGTWTVSAEGDYIWNWDASSINSPRGAVDLISSRTGGSSTSSGTPHGVPTLWGVPIAIWITAGIFAAFVVIGSVVYFFIRRRRRRAAK